ncbi:scavenger mRNA decapping enzyme [Mycena albidolilacea]|uniref:Scavenger mRNA decapping enzyme n=1 Tax=Mycena albidolilacea TaxID=1033008 RepID=A0AAD6ZQ92_9AGAR|nr:scavenger mRNA decapping enzyme [Mycena albidolilacea]
MEQMADDHQGTLSEDIFESKLQGFVFERILLEEPEKCRLTLLGSFPASFLAHSNQESTDLLSAIIRIEKTAVPLEIAQHIFPSQLGGFLSRVKRMESTDIYTWLAGWISATSMEKQPQGDVKVNIICPATDVHIRKYSKQSSILVRETPDIYKRIVEPYISAFPPERTRWVTEILEGRKEQSKILFSSSDFIVLPDMKWDLHTIGSLYLIAIVRDEKLRSLRDLRADKALGHVTLLKSIRREASIIAEEKWGIVRGGLRMYIHYQPSYYHFHVHIINANYEAGMGMSVGQAHLLEDVISLLELDEANPGTPGIFEKMTLTYGLGEQHGLYVAMKAAEAEG